MGALADLIAIIAQALFEATLWLAVLAAKPLRFLVSREYRQQVRAHWAKKRGQQVFDLAGGTIALALFGAAIIWWSSVLRRPSSEEAQWAQKLEKADRIIQKAREEIVARKKRNSQADK